MNDARDGRGPDGDEAGAEPSDETSALDAGDWLAAQFEDDGDGDGAVAGAGAGAGADADAEDVPESPVETERQAESELEAEPETLAVPISSETVSSPPFTVPPAPTAETDVARSSGHPLALDLSALAGAVPPPTPASPPAPSSGPVPAPSSAPDPAVDDRDDESPAAAPDVPARYEVPLAVAPRPAVAAPPAEEPLDRVAPGPLVPGSSEAEASDPDPDPSEADASGEAPADTNAPHPDEPGPFTALITPRVEPEPVFPSTFDWSAPAAPDDRAHDVQAAVHEDAPAHEQRDMTAEEARAASAAPADDARTRALELPVDESHDAARADGSADEEPEPAPESVAEPEPEPEPEAVEPEPEAVEPEPEAVEPEPEPACAEPELADEPEPEPEPEREQTGETVSPEPWWIAEHHEMTRRERREAEAAGVVVPPAVAAEPGAPSADADVESPAGSDAAPPAGLPFGAPVAAPAPSTGEPEPTFTELLGIVRPTAAAPETVEDTPGDPAADAGRSDLVDPGPLPSGGSWALSDELAEVGPSAAQPEDSGRGLAPESPGDSDGVDAPVDLDDAFAALQVEAEEDAPDAATAALPAAGVGAATGASLGRDRPRSVPHTQTELPGLSIEGGSPTVPAAASSEVVSGGGGGIASWSRGRKVLLGVAAALVIVLALVALFVLSRSLFAGTPQPTEAPAAAAVATRTVTAAPVELAPVAAAGPLATGTHAWSDLQGGECFSAFENAWQQDYDVVDCGQPHVAQLASLGALDADPAAAYPGSEALQSQMSVLCTAGAALDLAAASTYPDAQFCASWPSTEAEWAAGLRSYWCFVDRAGGEPMTTSVAPAGA